MVKVQVFIDDNQRILGFKADGHAGAAPAGEDVVCAGVTAITFTAVNGLEHFLGAAAIDVYAPGLGVLKCILQDPLRGDPAGKAQVILETMYLGLQNLAKVYPEYLFVEQRRCVPC
ncbi:MAG: ribosomal-processing cysteine protease Prp [Heliobacteriaceae bacterium]|nr:ribosomal-processing cysteine protease Prp [Heliobacteriaceae bacterium]MDD4586903.1 ribosomal-processing cysteine protease Prp [Heliobacteriaceae bacterium]